MILLFAAEEVYSGDFVLCFNVIRPEQSSLYDQIREGNDQWIIERIKELLSSVPKEADEVVTPQWSRAPAQPGKELLNNGGSWGAAPCASIRECWLGSKVKGQFLIYSILKCDIYNI